MWATRAAGVEDIDALSVPPAGTERKGRSVSVLVEATYPML
jgi:hypothetical protein